jgi:3',5'-cyclic AMP phosphodiesterase CpdA
MSRLITSIAAIAAALGLAAAAQAAPSPIAAYSLAAPTSVAPSGLVARAVLPAGSPCPSLRVDGRDLRMSWRRPAPNTGSAFAPVLVCDRAIPAGAGEASVGGVAIPAAMPATVKRIGVFDDSGCRILTGAVTQDCADDRAWPLARISRRVADSNPDVVLVPGDFFYRESACPAGQQALCAGSPPPVGGMPFTDQAYGWLADVLLPMQPVLRAAPLMVARGNHEACYRAGNGYMLFMDPRPGTSDDCAPVPGPNGALSAPEVVTAPYAIDLTVTQRRTLRMVITDSAEGSDTRVTAASTLMAPQFQKAAALAAPARGRESWLITHRPLFGFVSSLIAGPSASPWTSTDAVQAAMGTLGNYRFIVSGHIHVAQAVQVPGQPGQLVLGNGGTELDPPTGYATPAFGPGSPPYPAPTWSWTLSEFGYAVAQPGQRAGRWVVRLRDMDGRQQATCGVQGRTLSCTPRP